MRYRISSQPVLLHVKYTVSYSMSSGLVRVVSIAFCAGDLPERVLHVLHSDTAAGVGVDAKRLSDPLSPAVQASLTT